MKFKIDKENHINITINWSNDLCLDVNMPDVSPYDQNLEVYALGLLKNELPDYRSLVFYNNEANINGSIIGDYGVCYLHYPGHDREFNIELHKLNSIYDRVVFLIGRPMTDNAECHSWINDKMVGNVKNEVCQVVCRINNKLVLRNKKYQYNQFGAMTLFELCKSHDIWELFFNDKIYKQGLKRIIEEYEKTGNNK